MGGGSYTTTKETGGEEAQSLTGCARVTRWLSRQTKKTVAVVGQRLAWQAFDPTIPPKGALIF